MNVEKVARPMMLAIGIVAIAALGESTTANSLDLSRFYVSQAGTAFAGTFFLGPAAARHHQPTSVRQQGIDQLHRAVWRRERTRRACRTCAPGKLHGRALGSWRCSAHGTIRCAPPRSRTGGAHDGISGGYPRFTHPAEDGGTADFSAAPTQSISPRPRAALMVHRAMAAGSRHALAEVLLPHWPAMAIGGALLVLAAWRLPDPRTTQISRSNFS